MRLRRSNEVGSISQGASGATSIPNAFVRHYERRSVTSKAVGWGLLVAIVGLCLDSVFLQFHLSWFTDRVLENILEGTFFTVLVWLLLEARNKRIQRRFKEIGYLNHHIRNALTTIELAEGAVIDPGQRLEMIKEASTRIRCCIEKISRGNDCEINQQSPSEL